MVQHMMQTVDTPAAPASAVTSPLGRSVFGSFARFVLFGGGVGLASSLAVPLVATLMPWAAANALITVASTLLCTELYARFAFGAGRRAQWRQHMQSAGSATAAYLVTSAAVLVLHVVQPSAGIRWEQAVYLGASGLAGIGRFLVLRLYVFARGRTSGTEAPAARPELPRPLVHAARPTRAVHRTKLGHYAREATGRGALRHAEPKLGAIRNRPRPGVEVAATLVEVENDRGAGAIEVLVRQVSLNGHRRALPEDLTVRPTTGQTHQVVLGRRICLRARRERCAG